MINRLAVGHDQNVFQRQYWKIHIMNINMPRIRVVKPRYSKESLISVCRSGPHASLGIPASSGRLA